jgi:nitrogen fixation NifU-like protein
MADPHGPAATALYHEAIVAAARRASGHGRLDAADASIELDNPLCGDRVSMDVQVGGGHLRAVAHRVRGCLLCEAAASIIGADAVGETVENLLRLEQALGSALGSGFDSAALPWRELEVFAPVVHHPSRHRCVMLPFEALGRALTAALPAGAQDA